VRILLAGLILALGSTAAPAAQFDGDADVYLGWRDMKNHDFWGTQRYLGFDGSGTRDQGVFGIQGNFGVETFPINGEIAVIASSREKEFQGFGLKVTDTVSELALGALWRPLKDRIVQPYLGAGLASVGVRERQEVSGSGTFEDTDNSGGYYVHGGFKVLIAHHVNLGLDLRALRGTKVRLFSPAQGMYVDGDADYNQVTFRVGYSWGTRSVPESPRHERRERSERRVQGRRGPRTDAPEGDDNSAVGF